MTSTVLDRALNYYTGQGLPLQVFYAIGIVAAALLFLQFGLFFIGMDAHHDVDLTHPDGVGFISLRSIVAFFVGFGWTGVIAFKAGWGIAGATLAGFVAGAILMGSMVMIVRMLYAQKSSGNIRMENAVGKTGRVYLSIPANGHTGGQVQITFQGQMHTMPALSRAGEPIATGSAVIVREVIPPETLLVEKL